MSPRQKRQKLDADGGEVSTMTQEVDGGAITSQAKPADDKTQNTQLFVRSLAPETTTENLTDHFSQSDPIKHAVVVTDAVTKLCKGYGFVTLTDAEDAQKAKDEFNGSALLGRKIRVEVAEKRQRDKDAKRPEDGEILKVSEKDNKTKDVPQSQTRLIVRNLPWSINTSEKLEHIFRSYGKINQALLPRDTAGKLRGFGVVLVRGRKNAEKALEGVNGKEIDGRALAVDWAVNREQWEKAQDDELKDEEEDGDNISVKDEDAEERDMAFGGAVEDIEADKDDSDSDAESQDDGEEDGDVDEEDEQMKDEDNDLDKDEILLEDAKPHFHTNNDTTVFVRNLPFDCQDEELEDHFGDFGPLRYARVVIDRNTGRSKGTGFVCFRNTDDMTACLKDAPRQQKGPAIEQKKSDKGPVKSILQDETVDATGRYTMQGRVLQVTRAVEKSEANRLTAEGTANRFNRDKDKRHLYLLQEGTIGTNSPLYASLSATDITIREASLKQRKSFVEKNPSLHLSLTRLAIRNIPRTVNSKDLKALAREAVVGFAKDVKAGKRQALSKEELSRGGEEMRQVENTRRQKGKGVVKQAKIVFEGREGEKIADETGAAGRSRGYGFVEFHTHRNALMGLRWLNGHAIEYTAHESQKKSKNPTEDRQERKKRLIVEFALENAEIVQKRREREDRYRGKLDRKDSKVVIKERDVNGKRGATKLGNKQITQGAGRDGARNGKTNRAGEDGKSRKRKRGDESGAAPARKNGKDAEQDKTRNGADAEKLAKRQQIIGRKRSMRKAKRSGGKA